MPTEAQKRASAKYIKEHMLVVGCRITREQAEQFKEYCQGQNSSVNAVLKEFVLSKIENR